MTKVDTKTKVVYQKFFIIIILYIKSDSYEMYNITKYVYLK